MSGDEGFWKRTFKFGNKVEESRDNPAESSTTPSTVTSRDDKKSAESDAEMRQLTEEEKGHALASKHISITRIGTIMDRLDTVEGRVIELETTLAIEKCEKDKTKKRVMELETTLVKEKEEKDAIIDRLEIVERRAIELETSLAMVISKKEAKKDRLEIVEQRATELETSFVEEQQEAHRKSERLELRANDLERLYEQLSGSQNRTEQNREVERDWILASDEITVSNRIIGRGAWGEVLEGTFRGLPVAVKRIHELILSPFNRRLFEREMNMASRSRHPCLLQFIGATADDDTSPLFVTELLETSLRRVLNERALEPVELTSIALDVARALNYLHLSRPHPIIHRDISSANVLLWRQHNSWRAKLSDYGTANFIQQCATAGPGAAIYSAPEAGHTAQTAKIDVYSFGVLLCEMSIRELPDPRRRNQQVAMVTNERYTDLIRRCLQQSPEDRPDIAEVINILEYYHF